MAITVTTTVQAPLETVWSCWTESEHITQWNFAIDDWECPSASNDLRVGGTYTAKMAAKDGSFSFDFGGKYTEVVPMSRLAFVLDDGRNVSVEFADTETGILVTETFDPENENPESMQRDGWQSILNNFRKHVESHAQDGE